MPRSITVIEDRACQDGVFIFTCLGRRFEITGKTCSDYGDLTPDAKAEYNRGYDDQIQALIDAIPREPYEIVGADNANNGVIIRVRGREFCVRPDGNMAPSVAAWREAMQDAADEMAANASTAAATGPSGIPTELLA